MKDRQIAIVDDDDILRVALSDLMRSVGYRIRLFVSADDFLKTAERAEFSGVIADIEMPGSSGLELARIVGTDRSPLPVLLITARADVRFDEEARSAGAVALLRKPFDPAALIRHVEDSFR